MLCRANIALVNKQMGDNVIVATTGTMITVTGDHNVVSAHPVDLCFVALRCGLGRHCAVALLLQCIRKLFRLLLFIT